MSYNYWNQQTKQTMSIHQEVSFYKEHFPQAHMHLIQSVLKNLLEMSKIAEEILSDLGPSLDDEQYTSVIEMNKSSEYDNLFKETNKLFEEIEYICNQENNALEEQLSKTTDNKQADEIHSKMHCLGRLEYIYLSQN